MFCKLFVQRVLLVLPIFLLLIATPLQAADMENVPPPGPKDTCPVCGMFVARYPEWVATVVFADGHSDYFDGAKDMFKYLLDMKKWAPGRKSFDIKTIAVTEYYELKLRDGREAFYVIGSDVLGPMGHELIPLATEDDAKEFLEDHKGTSILRFGDVTLQLLEGLDKGLFE